MIHNYACPISSGLLAYINDVTTALGFTGASVLQQSCT